MVIVVVVDDGHGRPRVDQNHAAVLGSVRRISSTRSARSDPPEKSNSAKTGGPLSRMGSHGPFLLDTMVRSRPPARTVSGWPAAEPVTSAALPGKSSAGDRRGPQRSAHFRTSCASAGVSAPIYSDPIPGSATLKDTYVSCGELHPDDAVFLDAALR